MLCHMYVITKAMYPVTRTQAGGGVGYARLLFTTIIVRGSRTPTRTSLLNSPMVVFWRYNRIGTNAISLDKNA